MNFNDIRWNDSRWNDARLGLAGSMLSAALGAGSVGGADLVGASFTVFAADERFVIRIDSAVAGADGVWRYTMSVSDEGNVSEPLCENAAGEPDASLTVIPLRGTWDDQGGALAKCVDWGYAPWHTQSVCDSAGCHTITLDAHHQACTRAVRADYCGDGTPHTVTGTPINVFDDFGINADTENWGVGGAQCLSTPRLAQFATDTCVRHMLAAGAPICGDDDEALTRGRHRLGRGADAPRQRTSVVRLPDSQPS